MSRYLDPKNDLTFKRIFGEHKNLCMSLLNNILPLTRGQRITSLNYEINELLPATAGLKNSIVDVRCTDNNNNQFIVEMQMHWTDTFKYRVLFNAAKTYVQQLKSGHDYKSLKPVYALSFINEIFDPSPEYYHHYKMVNTSKIEKQIEGLELIFIELPKFKPTSSAKKKLYDLWLTFLRIEDNLDNIPSELLEEKVTQEAIQYLERSYYTEEELKAYDRYWDTVSTALTIYTDAKEEGRQAGIEEGIEKGRQEGREERERLAKEHEAALAEIARLKATNN